MHTRFDTESRIAVAQATDIARGIARKERGELFIHGENGQIRSRDSYGNDPCPPKDTDR